MRLALPATLLVALSGTVRAEETSILAAPSLNSPTTSEVGSAVANNGQWNTTLHHGTVTHNSTNNWHHNSWSTGCCESSPSCCRGIWAGYCKSRRSWCSKRSCGCKKARGCGCKRARGCGCKKARGCGCKKSRGCGCGNKIRHWNRPGRCGCKSGCNRCRWTRGIHVPRMDWTWLSHCNRCRRPRHRCGCFGNRMGWHWNRGCGTCGRKSCSGCGGHGHHHAGHPGHIEGTVIEEKHNVPTPAPNKQALPKPMPKKVPPKPMPKKEKSASKGLFDGIRILPAGFSL